MCAYVTPERPKAPLATLEDDGLDDDDSAGPAIKNYCQPRCLPWSPCSWHLLLARIRERRCCPQFCYSFTCTYVTYLLLNATLFCGILLLIILCTSLVAPYRRSLQFVPTVCHVESVNKTFDSAMCSCGRRCVARYDCLMIYGFHDVTDTHNHTTRIHTIIYDTEYDLQDQKVTLTRLGYKIVYII